MNTKLPNKITADNYADKAVAADAAKRLDSACSVSSVRRLIDLLTRSAPVFVVGGAVRDAVRGLEPKDLDLTTSLSPNQLLELLEQHGIHTIPTGRRHQTVTAILGPDTQPVEITTFHGPGMTPAGGVISGNSIEEDLSYRDFTMNAIAYCPISRQLIDPHHGAADIQKRTIRSVGEPGLRFDEDPLRILRMVRFATQTRFSIDGSTSVAASASAAALKSTSPERVRDEFSKILVSPQPKLGLQLLAQLELLPYVVPELEKCVGFEQNRYHRANVFDHTLEVVDSISAELVPRLAALFHDIGKPPTLSVDEETGDRHFFLHEKVGAEITKSALHRLRFPNAVTTAVVTLVETHMRPIEAGPGGLRRILRDTGELYPIWRELKEKDTLACKVDAEELKQRLAAFDQAMEEVKKGPPVSPLSSLEVDGHDILALGVRPSPAVGEILRALHELVLDNPELNTAPTLLELARKMVTERGLLLS